MAITFDDLPFGYARNLTIAEQREAVTRVLATLDAWRRSFELAALRTTAVTPTDIVASPAGGVGVITSTQPGSAPRQVQFGFKLMF